MSGHIVAGSASYAPGALDPLDVRAGAVMRYAFRLAGIPRPRVCYLGTASGDAIRGIASFYAACSRLDVRPSHLQLFLMPNHDPAEHLAAQDVIWVNGGSVANLLALWRLHGLGPVLRRAWENGAVLGGVSAGSICWYGSGITDSFGPQLAPVTDGLDLLPGSTAVHYDSEERRRPVYRQLVGGRTLPAGIATDDGVAVHYRGTEQVAVVADRPDAYAWTVRSDDAGGVVETRVDPTPLDPDGTPAG